MNYKWIWPKSSEIIERRKWLWKNPGMGDWEIRSGLTFQSRNCSQQHVKPYKRLEVSNEKLTKTLATKFSIANE